MRKLVIIVILLFIITVNIISEEVKTYKQQQNGNVTIYNVTIIKSDDSYHFQTSRNKGIQKQQASTDLTYATYSFSFFDTTKGTNYTSVRENDKIYVRGKIKNKDVKSELNISDQPWYQFLEEPLGNFAISSHTNMNFWTLEPTQAIPAAMEASKSGAEELSMNGTKLSAIRVRINLTGIFAAFWHADYLYNANNGRFLCVETTNGPGGGKVLIEQITPTPTGSASPEPAVPITPEITS